MSDAKRAAMDQILGHLAGIPGRLRQERLSRAFAPPPDPAAPVAQSAQATEKPELQQSSEDQELEEFYHSREG